MANFGLTKNKLDFILQILKENIKDDGAKFYIFGSRAKEKNQKYSDIDIAIKIPNKKLNADVLAKILIAFKDSTLPYFVDVIDLNDIDEKFYGMIEGDLREIS